jgi:DNA-binding transcriptional LysR family regulator
MTFEQIRTFLVVASAGNFTRAAQQLFLSQPAVSQHVLALEKQLGRKLFDRKGRSLSLTMAGRRFITYAQAVILDTDTMVADLQALDDPLQGVVSIGAINSVGVYVLPGAIARFQQQHPSVRIELKIGNTEQVTDELMHGKLDLAVIDAIIAPSASRNLRRDDYKHEDGALIVPPGHPWSGRDDVTVDELYGQTSIMRERGARSRATLESELARLGVDLARLAIGFELGSTEAIKQAVASGLGIGFVPACGIQRELSWSALGRARFEQGRFGRQLWLYSPVRQGQAERIRMFRDFLLEFGPV